jgi:hypothetical protein
MAKTGSQHEPRDPSANSGSGGSCVERGAVEATGAQSRYGFMVRLLGRGRSQGSAVQRVADIDLYGRRYNTAFGRTIRRAVNIYLYGSLYNMPFGCTIQRGPISTYTASGIINCYARGTQKGCKMKKCLMMFTTALLSLYLVCGLVYAGNTSVGITNPISVPLKLQVFEDGKPTENFIVGTLLISNTSGTVEIFWDNVYIHPLNTEKIVLLKPEHYYTRNDIFEDITINQDSFSFTMVMPPQANRIRISGNKNKGDLYHSIKGEGVFGGLYPGDKSVKIEWKQANKVILPFNEVY